MSDLVLNLRIRANADGTAQVLGQTGDGIRRVSTESGNASNALRGMESAASGLIRTIAPLIGIYEAVSFGRKVVEDTATVQDLDTRLHSLTKTAGDYAQTVGYIDTVADKQHKKINDLADGYAKLRNLQNSGLITAGRTKEFFEGLNDAASALGVGNDQLKQTFFGLSQSLGMLNAENFNQVMEPIPGLLQAMDTAAKLPAGGFKNLVNEGKATVAFFSDTLAKALHTFDGAAAATANNINAKTTDISNSWTRLIKTLEKPISVNLNPALDDINSLLKALAELNGSAVIGGIVATGKIVVAVYAVQMVKSVGAYIVAKQSAMAVEAAHNAAITENIQRNIAGAQSTVNRLEVQLGYIRAQQAAVAAEKATLQSTIASSEAVMNQARATLIATDAMIQNTSIMYIRRQALASMSAAEAGLATTTLELAAAQQRQAVLSDQIALSMTAQVAATQSLAAAQASATAAAATSAVTLKALLVPMNLVNLGLAGLVGWEIGKWLNSFETVRITATATLGAILQGLENVSYYWDRLQIVLSKGGNKDARLAILKEGHLAAKKAIDDNIVSTIAYELNGGKAADSANQLASSQNSVAVAAGQSSKEIKEVIKDLEQQIKYQAELAKVTNASIDAQIKDLDRLNTARAAGLDAERKANDWAHEQHKVSAQAYLDIELSLIDKATQAKVDALNQQAALQKTKLDEQVTDVDKAYEAIRMIESKNQAGQVNKSTFALGQGQVLPSTLGMPGFGMVPYADMAAIEKIKGDYSALVDYVKAHETELAAWGKSYFEHLAVYYKSIPVAVKHYGDGTDAYMSKYMQNVALINGSTINQIKLAGEQKDIEAEIAKVVADGQAQKTAAMQKSITESQTYVRALEDERVKLLELTGEATRAREAKASLALERNPAYQQAVVSGNAADVQTFKDANAAELFNANTASANAYQDRLDAINKSTKEIGITSTESFDVINKGFGGLVGTFNSLTDSIDKATNALVDNAKQARDAANDKTLDPKQRADLAVAYAAKEKALEADRVKTALTGTRQIASAFSNMLDKNSSEYKAAHAIEMGLAGAELAMQIMKITGIGAVAAAETASAIPAVAATELKTTAKFGETWATEQQLFAISSVLAAETASTAPSVASSTLKGEAKAAEAVATQASAGPGIGFALMAAMAAAMAAIGFMGGKSSVASMGPQGMSPDTGTVLGDSSAKSQSIDKTYQLLKDIHAEEYATLRSIDRGIANLHSGITDVITRLFQAGGLSSVATNGSSQLATGLDTNGLAGIAFQTALVAATTRKALEFANLPTSFFGMKIDPISNFLVNGIFGGKQTSNVTAQGISTNATSLSDIMSGGDLSAQQFAQIETKTDGGWFGKDKFSFSTQYSALDDATQKALNDVFKSMGDTMLGLADALGGELSDRVKNYIIPALSVDLKGLDGEAAAKKLNGVLSTALDTMSTDVFGDILGQYQQLGEGMLETAVRIVSEIAVVEDALSKSGLSISGDAIAISDGLAQAAGGLQEFQKQFDNYYQKFYSDAERNVFLQKGLTTQLSDVNSVLPETRDGYRALIESLDINNSADQERYSLLIKLSEAADTYYSVLEDEQNKYNELSIRLLETQGKAAEALNEKRKLEIAALDDTSAAIMEQIYVTEDNIKYASLTIQLLEAQGYSYAALNEKRKFELESLDATSAAIMEQIYATEDNIKHASLTIQLLEKQGYSYAALNEKRKFELESLDATSAAIMEQIYAAEDSAKSMSLYIKSMEVQGMATEALAEKRKIELNALSETDKAIQESIYAVEDYTAALKKESDAKKALITAGYDGVSAAMKEMQQSFDAAKKTISDQYKADSDALKNNLDTALASYETQKTAATDLLGTLTTLAGNLKSALQSTVVESGRLNSIRRSAAQDVLQSALTSARAGNSLANYPGLEAALSDIAKPSEDFYSTFFEYKRDQGRTAGVLDELSSYTDAQVSVAQQTLDAIVSASDQAKSDYDAQYKLLTDTYNSNIAYYDSLLDWFQKGVDVLNGIDIWTLSVSDAITGATDAILALAKTAGYEGSYAPNTYSSAAGASISGSTATGLSGIGYNTDAVKQFVSDSVYGGDFQTLYDWAKNEGFSATSLDYLMGWTSGAMNLEAASHGLPSFDVGINNVPFDMLALIHKDERIFPAADNRELMMRLSEPVRSSNNNSEVAAEIRLLRQDNRVQAQAIVALQLRIVKQLEQWEGDGIPETRDVSV